MTHLLLVSQQVAVLFMMMAVGLVCRRTKMLGEAAVKGMIDLLVIVVTPAVIVNVFSRPFNAAEFGGLGEAAILSFAIHLAAIAIAELVFRRGPDDTRVVLKLGSVFTNSGFMGIPMEKAVLGDIGVFYGVVYMSVFNLLIWSYGIARMKKGGHDFKASLKTVLVNPGTIGLAMGLVVFLMPGELPALLAHPVRGLADLNTPLAMIVIGYYLGGVDLRQALSSRGAVTALALQLVVIPLVFIAIAYPLVRCGFGVMPVKALMIAVSAPTAAMVSMFAAKFDRDVHTSVALVSGSTALSMATMPVMIAIALVVFP